MGINHLYRLCAVHAGLGRKPQDEESMTFARSAL
jgi:hypothetical protein